jgi:hypothetical protein
MATYYVRKSGSNGNDGLSPAAAKLTLESLIDGGNSSIAVGGDTIYVGAGVYYSESITCRDNHTTDITVIGDVMGQYTGDAGQVRICAATSATAHDAAAVTVSLSTHFVLRDIVFEQNGATSYANIAINSFGHAVSFTRCAFVGGQVLVYATGTPPATLGPISFDSCIFVSHPDSSANNAGIEILCDYYASAQNLDIDITNCVFVRCSHGISITQTGNGTGSSVPNGITVYHCTFLCHRSCVNVDSANVNTTYPTYVYNSFLFRSITTDWSCLRAQATGQIVEDYNAIHSDSARTNVSVGSGSVVHQYLHSFLDLGMSELILGLPGSLRTLAPSDATSNVLGRGNQAGGPSTDMIGGPRPSGGESTAYGLGPMERNDCGAQESTTKRTGSSALVITGPGYHDLLLPVNASSTTVSIYGRYDSSHAATNKPQIKVLNGAHIGVSDATATMTAAADTWEALTLSFTPTAKGVVTIRVVSRSASGSGHAYFDS